MHACILHVLSVRLTRATYVTCLENSALKMTDNSKQDIETASNSFELAQLLSSRFIKVWLLEALRSLDIYCPGGDSSSLGHLMTIL